VTVNKLESSPVGTSTGDDDKAPGSNPGRVLFPASDSDT